LDELDHLATPLDEVEEVPAEEDTSGTADPAPAAPVTDDPPVRHSRSVPLGMRIRAARIARGWE
jgi:hypothetical protein